jgi:septum formation protein
MSQRLLLASRSPRRRSLLTEARYEFDVVDSGFDEPPPRPGASAEEYAMELARGKAHAAASALGSDRQGDVVLAADTVVDLAGEILGQPASNDEAVAMLGRLSGSTHAVVTGVVLLDTGTGRTAEAAARTTLRMRPMSEEDIRAYVSSGESRGKAGSYAIQETGDRFVSVVEGSLTNVVGLPMEMLSDMIARFAPGLAPPADSDEDALSS